MDGQSQIIDQGLGWLDQGRALALGWAAAAWLQGLTVGLGNITFSMMALVRGGIAGGPLVEGQTTVGDYVELDGGEKGRIVRMTARSCILETFHGRWIVVPNDHFITAAVAALPFVLDKPDGPDCELKCGLPA